MPCPDVVLEKRRDDLWIQVTANIAAGWRKYQKTHAYRGLNPHESSIPLADNYYLWVSLIVYARPNRLGQYATPFPRNFETRYGDEDLYCTVKEGVLRVDVRLSKSKRFCEDLPWRLTERGNASVQWNPWSIGLNEHISYELNFKAVFVPESNEKPKDIREWNLPFPSGGLPSLGKRH